jgi:hypothetical protein
MPNPIKYATGSETLVLKKGNFYIGTGDVGKGPTSSTGYYNGITPPSGGYTIYLNKATGGPSIYTASNDAQLISLTNSIAGTSYTTVNQCLVYYAGQTDKMIFNRDLSPIRTENLKIHLDPGFTCSYPQSGSSFTNLVTSDNGVLYNNVSFTNTDGNGAFSFDGVDDYGVVLENTPSWLLGDPSFTLCGYFKRNGDWTSGGVWGIGGSSGGINSWNSNNTNQITIDYWGSPTYTTQQTYSLDTWKFCAWRKKTGEFNKTNISIFVNDTEYTGNNLIDVRGGTRNVNISVGGVNLAIAGRYESYYHSKAVIGMFSIYDTNLSNQEILNYYNSTKSRFGL